MSESVLDVQNVSTAFKIDGKFYKAISDINLSVNRDEILSLVGESGCGKSTLAETIMRLQDSKEAKSEGKIVFEGQNLLDLNEKKNK